MADTYITLVNQVLLRLREDEVSTVSETDYSKLIGLLINEAKTEIEDQWDWSALRQNINVTLVGDSNTTDYSLIGSNKRTRVLGAYNTTQDYPLRKGSYNRINEDKAYANDVADAYMYTSAGVDSSDQLKIRFYPPGTITDIITVACVVPQADLSTGTDQLLIPALPVILKAYAKAVSERGEDGGVSYEEADRKAAVQIGDAVLRDQQWFNHDELVWRVV